MTMLEKSIAEKDILIDNLDTKVKEMEEKLNRITFRKYFL
jgi:hypothetical protein